MVEDEVFQAVRGPRQCLIDLLCPVDHAGAVDLQIEVQHVRFPTRKSLQPFPALGQSRRELQKCKGLSRFRGAGDDHFVSLPEQPENKLRGPRRRIIPDIGQRFAGVLFFRLFRRDSPHFKPRLDLIPRLGAVLCFFPFGIVLESRRRRDDRHACPFRRQVLAGFLGIFCAGFVSIGNDDHTPPIQQPMPGTNDPAAGFVATGQISQLRQIVRVLFSFREENEVARMSGNQVFMVQRHGKTFRLAFCPLARVIIGAGIGVVHNGIARPEIFRLVPEIQRPKPARFVPVFIHGGNGRRCFPF